MTNWDITVDGIIGTQCPIRKITFLNSKFNQIFQTSALLRTPKFPKNIHAVFD